MLTKRRKHKKGVFKWYELYDGIKYEIDVSSYQNKEFVDRIEDS